MYCHHCTNKCIKKGRRKDGTQKYQCRNCRKHQLYFYKNKAWHPDTNNKITRCIKRSAGMRGIAYILEIAPNTVRTRVKKIADNISKPKVKMGKEYEADELKTYVGKKKNEQWIIYAIDKKTRQVADFRIGRRNKTNLKKVMDTLLIANAKKIWTDGLSIYKGLIPVGIHKVVVHNTNYIERMNLNIRTHLKRLTRKTICFSKNIVMLEAIMRIYFWGA